MRSGVARKTRCSWMVPVAMVCSLFTEEVVDTRTTNGRLGYRHRCDQGKPILLHGFRGGIKAGCLRVARCALRVAPCAPSRACQLLQSDATGSLACGGSDSVDM